MKTKVLVLIFMILLVGCIFDNKAKSSSNENSSLIKKETIPTSNQTPNISIQAANNSIQEQNSTASDFLFPIRIKNFSYQEVKSNESQTTQNNSNKTKIPHDIAEIYFFDVGLGDATLIRTNDTTILIGTGPANYAGALVQKLNLLKLQKIDELIIDSWADNKIGGFSLLLKKFPISRVWASKEVPNTKAASTVLSLIEKNKIELYNPKAGQSVNFGDLDLFILNPSQEANYPNQIEPNSIVLLVKYGKFCLFLPSDFPAQLDYLLFNFLAENQTCDVFKWRKNGEGFTKVPISVIRLSPKEVIISAGPSNFGEYPNPTTLVYLSIAKLGVHRTDIDKDIFINASKIGQYSIIHKADLEKLGQWYSSTQAYLEEQSKEN